MITDFINIFKQKQPLDANAKKDLVRSLWQYVNFDDLFFKSKGVKILPADVIALIQIYGPFWVDIQKNEKKQSVVITDITQSTDVENAALKYYDASDNNSVLECNFSDFIKWVYNANITDIEQKQALVRLRKSPFEGAKTDTENKEIVKKSIEKFGDKYFKNATDINEFFKEQTGYEFCEWFRKYIGKKGPWGKDEYLNKDVKRGDYTIQSDADARFQNVWNAIPSLLEWNQKGVNLFQFLALNSIMINELKGSYKIIGEKGSLLYTFNEKLFANGKKKESYNYYYKGDDKRKDLEKESNEIEREKLLNDIQNEVGGSNHTVYFLFNDRDFLVSNLNSESENIEFIKTIEDSLSGLEIDNYPPNFPEMFRYILELGRFSEEWKGKIYPDGFPLIPEDAGIIAEADFYKFRGRGLNQLTFRYSYSKLIEKILNYNGSNKIIKEYRDLWKIKYNSNVKRIATSSLNKDWDNLFFETNLEVVAMAIDVHQKRIGYYEKISMNNSESTFDVLIGSGIGSFYRVGTAMGGKSNGYGDVVRNRIIFMLDNLNNF